jgi:hypothetical protein
MDLVDQWVASGGLFEGLDDDRLDVVITNGARCARAGLVMETFETLGHKAPAPLARRGDVNAQLARHRRRGLPRRCQQHDATAQGQGLGALRPPAPAFERRAFVVAQLDRHQLRTWHYASHRR